MATEEKMATLKEMCSAVDSITMDIPSAYGIQPFPLNESKYYLLKGVMIIAEDEGQYYNGVHGAYNEPCTYWVVGDYIITYLTDDWGFNAAMLTDDMMDDLIIEVV